MIQKKIAHLIATNFYGGPEKQIIEHLKILDSNRYPSCLISFIENEQKNEILDKANYNNIENFGISMSKPYDIRALSSLIKTLRKNEIKLLLTHGYKSTVLGWIAARRIGIPIIAFSRGYTSENLKVAFYQWLDKRVLKFVDGIISVSEGQKKKLLSYNINKKNHWVVHNAISISKNFNIVNKKLIKKTIGIPDNAMMIVSAGRLSPEKGHKYLIEAIYLIKKSLANVYFVICGDGICRSSLEKKAKDLGIDKICKFIGYRKDLENIFYAMDFLVLPSLSEGLPNVVLEAFAASKSVIATEVGGVPEVIIDQKNGILVSPAKSNKLGDAILELIESQEKRLVFGRDGYLKVKNNFTFEGQNKKLVEIYDEILIDE